MQVSEDQIKSDVAWLRERGFHTEKGGDIEIFNRIADCLSTLAAPDQFNYQAGLNDLVRESYDAQEAFDNYDSNKSDESQRELGRLVKHWDMVNIRMINYVIAHGKELIVELCRYGDYDTDA